VQDQRVLRDYAMPQLSSIASSIVSPANEAYNFKLQQSLISLVQKDQFGSHPSQNPSVHLRDFLVKCDTIKLNVVPADAITNKALPILIEG